MILDLQMYMEWWQWQQWQQNADDDGGDSVRGDGDGDDGCHGPTGHSEGVCAAVRALLKSCQDSDVSLAGMTDLQECHGCSWLQLLISIWYQLCQYCHEYAKSNQGDCKIDLICASYEPHLKWRTPVKVWKLIFWVVGLTRVFTCDYEFSCLGTALSSFLVITTILGRLCSRGVVS